MSRAMERMLQLLQEIRDNTESNSGTSSVEIEDLASKPEPKVTTKTFAGSVLTKYEIDLVLQAHAYAKRRLHDMALNGWQETIDLLQAKRQTPSVTLDADGLEELPDFDEVKA